MNNTITRSNNQTKSYYGGGIYIQGDDRSTVARPVITDNLIEGNVSDPPAGRNNDPARGIGGGIYSGFYAAPVIRGNVVRANRAGNISTEDQQGGGGGIAFYSGIDVSPALVDANRVENTRRRTTVAASCSGNSSSLASPSRARRSEPSRTT